MLVKPIGEPVPFEASRKRIESEHDVPDTAYYRRRIAAGELEIVAPKPKLVPPAKKSAPCDNQG